MGFEPTPTEVVTRVFEELFQRIVYEVTTPLSLPKIQFEYCSFVTIKERKVRKFEFSLKGIEKMGLKVHLRFKLSKNKRAKSL